MPRKRRKQNKKPSTSAVGAAVDVQRPNIGLLSLPTELIEMVVNKIGDDEDVYSLALLSKRLHFLALPIFISRQSGSLRYGFLNLHLSPLKLLRAARVALYVQELQMVSVTLMTLEPNLRILKALGRLVSRLRCVRNFSLSSALSGFVVDQKQLAEGLAGFAKILGGKGCTSISIHGLYLGSGQSVDFRSDIPPLTTLQLFDIRSSVLVNPSIRTWIIRSINMSPISQLILTQATLSADNSFGKDLGLLTLPSLRALSIVSRGSLRFSDLAAFLCRHRGINTLTLTCDTNITFRTPKLPKDALPSLHTLHSTPRFIQHFLSPPGSLPNLRQVDLDPDFSQIRGTRSEAQLSVETRLADVENALAVLASRDGVSALGFHLPLDGTADNWLTMGSHPRRGTRTRQGKRNDIERSLAHIKTFYLRSTVYYSISTSTLSLIPKWLSLFPSLQHADFGALFGRRPPAENESFLQAVADACPGMTTVQLGLYSRAAADLRAGASDE